MERSTSPVLGPVTGTEKKESMKCRLSRLTRVLGRKRVVECRVVQSSGRVEGQLKNISRETTVRSKT